MVCVSVLYPIRYPIVSVFLISSVSNWRNLQPFPSTSLLKPCPFGEEHVVDSEASDALRASCQRSLRLWMAAKVILHTRTVSLAQKLPLNKVEGP